MHRERDDRFWIQLQHAPIDVAAATDFLRVPRSGGIDLFLGTTRQWTGGIETVELTYECYAPLALREMHRLLMEAAAAWPVERACLFHRLGVVPVAEASVLVGVATPHRADAFAATRWVIDTLKRQVPIWKRERYRDGATEWVEGEHPPDIPEAGCPAPGSFSPHAGRNTQTS